MLSAIRHRFRLNAKPACQLGSLKVRGRAKVIGSVTPSAQLLRAPITGRSCVFYWLWLEEWFNGSKTPLLEEQSSELFRIEDATGSALVDPARVELNLRGGTQRGHSSEHLEAHRAVLARHGFGMVDEYGELRSMAFREIIVSPGARLCALGSIRQEADPAGTASYREQPTRFVLGSDAEFKLLLSTPR